MTRYKEDSNPSLNLMLRRLGVFNDSKPTSAPLERPNPLKMRAQDNIEGVTNIAGRMKVNGGYYQQERMIFDKRRTLERALLYSYQSANVKKLTQDLSDLKEEGIVETRVLINPDKTKQSYDDKIISGYYEDGWKPGDIFEWTGTQTHWLIYLQDTTELAYFRGSIRRCSYTVNWEDEDGLHSSYMAVQGPVETRIDYVQKHEISIDKPNFSLDILMPANEATVKYFRRYAKFYLKGLIKGSPDICWRTEAVDWISTPGIIRIHAVEYYINKEEDDIEKGLVGSLITKPENPNSNNVEQMIEGPSFIKPKLEYEFTWTGISGKQWSVDKRKYPVKLVIDNEDPKKCKIKWIAPVSGQFELTCGNVTKTIIVESLF